MTSAAPPDPSASLLGRYEARTALAMTGLAVFFIAVYAVQVLWTGAPTSVVLLCDVVLATLWLVFAVDLALRVALARRRAHYLSTHLLDVATVVLPALRPLRVLRVFTAGQAIFSRGSRLPVLRIAQALAAAVVVLILISALAVLDAERTAPGSRITEFGDALWWAATTVTTVGYGDLYPVSGEGRIVAVALMFVGVSLLGLVTATLGTWFLAHTNEAVAEETEAVAARLAAVERRLADLTDLLRERGDGSDRSLSMRGT